MKNIKLVINEALRFKQGNGQTIAAIGRLKGRTGANKFVVDYLDALELVDSPINAIR
ncbi:hypothetical protein LJ051_17510 [Escherichia coli]|nr:hypothetical protein LJ051_17510 [Escherichia coli]